MHKLFGRGDLYCWNCGGRQHVGKKRCPHCGAYYNNSTKPVTKRVKAHPGLGPLHYTVISYIVKYILFSILFAFGWCCIMYFFMDVTFVDDGEGHDRTDDAQERWHGSLRDVLNDELDADHRPRYGADHASAP